MDLSRLSRAPGRGELREVPIQPSVMPPPSAHQRVPTEHTPIVTADRCDMEIGPDGACLVFVERLPLTPGQMRAAVAVRLSAQQAKMIAIVLRRLVKSQEDKAGQIEIPPDLLKAGETW